MTEIANTITERNPNQQPVGLGTLFFAELWERFGFYCIQSLLVLYLSKVFLFSDSQSYILFSAFSALIYATPVIGGYIADKYFGFRRSIILGGVLYFIGYTLLSVPNNPYFYLALSFIIWGNGFFKSNVSSLLGTLYTENDPRRDSGFTLFYMGINIGSFSSPIICTYLATKFGWNYGFGAAGLGMLICIANCLFGFRSLGKYGRSPSKELHTKIILGISLKYYIYVAVLLAIFITSYLMHFDQVVNIALIIFSAATILFLFYLTFKYDDVTRKKLVALLILIMFSIFFWAFYMQTFLSITLFIDRNVDRHILGYLIPTAMYQSINPFFIIALSPILAQVWLALGRSRFNLSTPMKFAIGLLFIGAGFLSLTLGIHLATLGMMATGWMVFAFFMQTLGELSLSPIGLSAVTKFAPPELTGMLMGVWFLSLAGAFAIAGRIATLTSLPLYVNSTLVSAKLYGSNFLHFGICALAFGLMLSLLTPKLKRMMLED